MGYFRRPRCALTTNAVLIWRGIPKHVVEEISLEHGLVKGECVCLYRTLEEGEEDV